MGRKYGVFQCLVIPYAQFNTIQSMSTLEGTPVHLLVYTTIQLANCVATLCRCGGSVPVPTLEPVFIVS